MKFISLRWCSAILIFICIAGTAYAQGLPPLQRDARGLSDLTDEPRHKALQSIDAFFRDRKPIPDRSANDLGWDCLAATALLDQGNDGVSANVQSIADQLAANVILSKKDSKPIGWGASIQDQRCPEGGYDAFGDGTCNSKDTTYAFQTGLGIACLAKASVALNDPKLLGIAKNVLDHWQTYILSKALCDGCIYFAPSDNQNDNGRYVRNMNVFMALGAATLGQATHNKAFIKIASQAMQSEIAERNSGNRGYLGKLDPQWLIKASESDRIENHSAAVAVLSLEIGRLLDSDEITSHGLAVWRDWATCDNERCRKANCKYWAGNADQCQATHTAAHCAFRFGSPLASTQCQRYLKETKRVPSFGIWAVLLGGDHRR